MYKSIAVTGLILGLSISMTTQILTWMGLGLTQWFVFFTYLLIVVFIITTQRRVWLQNNKSLSLYRAFLTVFLMVIISRYVFQFYMFCYTTYIEPGWVNKVSDYWTNLMLGEGKTIDYIDTQIESFRNSYRPINMFTIEIIRYGLGQMIIGLLASLYFVFKSPNREY